MTTAWSLRSRLILVILAPLLIIAMLVGIWAYFDAQDRAAERFDRSLLSTALSISRDIAVTGGDALSEDTRDLLRDTSGGAVFYHVYAPDGVFVTGYATPPVPPTHAGSIPEQTYYDAEYQGNDVRALRFTQIMIIDNLSGPFTYTVWQNTALRDGFVRGRTNPTFLIIALLMGALAIVVWFGVRIGLHPLLDLEDAIEQRSPDDLAPIKRTIPNEVGGIVRKLNALLGELDDTLDAKDRLISNAAHQLRNPIAGVLSLAEAVQSAKTPEDVAMRSGDLIDAARQTSKLANNLLALERARATPPGSAQETFDPNSILLDVALAFDARCEHVAFSHEIESDLPTQSGDAIMFEQAVLNLLNNALMHGGASLSRIDLRASSDESGLTITVQDDGKGIEGPDLRKALARFGQVEPSEGSGLGLPIAVAVAKSLGGQLIPNAMDKGFSISMILPRQPAQGDLL